VPARERLGGLEKLNLSFPSYPVAAAKIGLCAGGRAAHAFSPAGRLGRVPRTQRTSPFGVSNFLWIGKGLSWARATSRGHRRGQRVPVVHRRGRKGGLLTGGSHPCFGSLNGEIWRGGSMRIDYLLLRLVPHRPGTAEGPCVWRDLG